MLLIDENIREQIKKVIARAKESVFVITSNNEYTAPLDEHSIVIPMGVTVTYTEEKQPVGLYRHLSISVDGDPKLLPQPHVCELIMKEFGFENDMSEAIIKMLPCGKVRHAVNIWEEIK